MIEDSSWRRELYALLKIAGKDADLLEDVLNDLLTPEEISVLAQRWQIVKGLAQNRPQREIAEELGVGIATVTRGARLLKKPQGGLRRIIDMIHSTKTFRGLPKSWRDQLME